MQEVNKARQLNIDVLRNLIKEKISTIDLSQLEKLLFQVLTPALMAGKTNIRRETLEKFSDSEYRTRVTYDVATIVMIAMLNGVLELDNKTLFFLYLMQLLSRAVWGEVFFKDLNTTD